VDAIRFWRSGLKVGKVGVSDKSTARHVYLSDVRGAFERAGLTATRWDKQYDRGDEPDADAPKSLYFRVAREVADVAGMALPNDLKRMAKRAAQHQYGTMSKAMVAAQKSELAERRQRLDDLRRRLTTAAPALEERRRRLKELASRLTAAAPRLQEPAGLSA
jgi:hypothetical protein